jgi:hypothetical protein
LSGLGYKDYSISFKDDRKTIFYYTTVLFKFIKLFFTIKKGSVVATQYPLPTVGYLFVYFIRLAASRGISFLSVIHDVNTLRAKEFNRQEMNKEMKILGAYNGLIVHNDIMKNWLVDNGLGNSPKAVSLKMFDYISSADVLNNKQHPKRNEIAFAGHLAKSLFIYNLDNIKNWSFNIYGSNFETEKNKNINTTWKGEFSPDELVYHLQGSFGLVWDGLDSNKIETNTFGNYMRYNNPFKFSLYIAAGLPVIAPASAAIASTIVENNIGFLINDLDDLSKIDITDQEYEVMKNNVKEIQKDVIAGNYLKTAVQKLEQSIKADI